MAFSPQDKHPGDLIKSQDWNDAMTEVVRLGNDKVNKSGDTISGNVGIGVAPADKLDVNGDLRLRGNLKDASGMQRLSAPSGGNLELKDAGGTARVTIVDNGNLELKKQDGATSLTLDTAGKVGVGIAPSDVLDVNGDLRVRGNIKDANGTQRLSAPANGSLELKDASGTARVTIVNNGNLELKKQDGATSLTIDSTGKVGVGTTPSEVLDVNGDLCLRGNLKDANGTQRLSAPMKGLLELKDSGGTARLAIADDGTLELKGQDGNTALTVDVRGRVGIGCGDRLSMLTVRGKNSFSATGTVRTTSDSRVVIGSGTKFLSELGIGDRLYVVGAGTDPGETRRIASISSDTTLTVDTYFWRNRMDGRLTVYPMICRIETNVGNPALVADFDGRIGVNVGTESLDVNGNIRVTGSVGIGTANTGADFLDVRGRCYSSGGWQTTDADYAEFFETEGSAIPVATPVVLAGKGQVRAAKKGETPFGIVTAHSAVVGNHFKEWPRKYVRDKYGQQVMEKVKEELKVPKKKKVTKERQKTSTRRVTEEVVRTEVVQKDGKYIQLERKEAQTREVSESLFEEVALYDEKGKTVIGTHRLPVIETYEEEVDVLDERGQPVMVGSGEFLTVERPKVNPEWDETKPYVLRSERPEWCCVGLLGQLRLRKGKPVAPTWTKMKDLEDDVELWLVK